MVAFIDDHRKVYGVESICALLPIAPSTYFRHKAQQADPARRSARAQRDDELRAIIRRIWTEHFQVYGPRKVWRQMGREGLRVARCRVRRLMRAMGLAGAVRGRAWVTTTQSPTGRIPAGGSRRAELHRHAPESALGLGLHVRRHLARLCLCGVRHRCLRATDCRLAGIGFAAHRSRLGCARAGDLRPMRRRYRRPGASQRSRHAVSVDPLHRAAR